MMINHGEAHAQFRLYGKPAQKARTQLSDVAEIPEKKGDTCRTQTHRR